jgi:hypothetical protein
LRKKAYEQNDPDGDKYGQIGTGQNRLFEIIIEKRNAATNNDQADIIEVYIAPFIIHCPPFRV